MKGNIIMTEQEYQSIQTRFREKLKKRDPKWGGNVKGADGYKEGIRTCMSILSDMYHMEARYNHNGFENIKENN